MNELLKLDIPGNATQQDLVNAIQSIVMSLNQLKCDGKADYSRLEHSFKNLREDMEKNKKHKA